MPGWVSVRVASRVPVQRWLPWLWAALAVLSAGAISRGIVPLGEMPEAGHILAHLVIFGVLARLLDRKQGPALPILGSVVVGVLLEVAQALGSGHILWNEGIFDVSVDAVGAAGALACTGRKDVAALLNLWLHPAFILPAGLVARFYLVSQDARKALLWTGITLLFLIAPTVLWLLGVALGWFTDFDLSDRRQRAAPFVLVCLSLAALTLTARLTAASPDVVTVAEGMALSATVVTGITLLGFKVSGHVVVPVLLVVAIAPESSRECLPFLGSALISRSHS